MNTTSNLLLLAVILAGSPALGQQDNDADVRKCLLANPAGATAPSVEACDRLLAKAPLNLEEQTRIYIAKADLLARNGTYDESIATLSSAIDAGAKALKLFDKRATYYGMTRQFEKALHDRDFIVSKAPTAEAYGARALVYKFLGQHKESISDYTAALRLSASKAFERKELLIARAEVYAAVGSKDAALADLKEFATIDPDPASDFYRSGLVKRDLKLLDGAISDYGASLKVKPDAAVFASRAWAHVEAGRRDAAIKDLSSAIALNDHSRTYYLDERKKLYVEAGLLAEAVRDLDELIKSGAKSGAAVYAERADLKWRASPRDRDGAMQDVASAIGMDPSVAHYHYLRSFYRYSQRPESELSAELRASALADARKSVELKADAASYRTWLWWLLQEGKAYDEALLHAEMAIRLDPKATAHGNYAWTLYHLGRYRDAVAKANAALELEPKFANGYLTRGLATIKLGSREAGMRDLEKAAELSPKSPLIQRMLAEARSVGAAR